MKKNRYYIITFFITICAVIFGISYNWTVKKYRNIDNSAKKNIQGDKFVLSKGNEIISPDANIVLKLKVKDIDKEFFIKTLKAKDLNSIFNGNITLNTLENYYGTVKYNLISSSAKEIVFLRESYYEPSKYYLGPSTDGYITIFKCSEDGTLIIEDEVNDKCNKKVDTLPESDKELINSFKMKYEQKQEAQDELSVLCS